MVIVTRPRDHQDAFYRHASIDYSHAYTRILRAARGGEGAGGSAGSAPILLLVATDVDAVCATRALAALLSDDDIAYRVCPVDGYATLQRIIEDDVVGNTEVRRRERRKGQL